jgi:hypothetical protein
MLWLSDFLRSVLHVDSEVLVTPAGLLRFMLHSRFLTIKHLSYRVAKLILPSRSGRCCSLHSALDDLFSPVNHSPHGLQALEIRVLQGAVAKGLLVLLECLVFFSDGGFQGCQPLAQVMFVFHVFIFKLHS